MSAGGSLALSGMLSGTTGLVKNGDGTLTLSSVSTYTGDTVINAGTLAITSEFGADVDLGDPSSNVDFAGGTLRVFGPPAGVSSRTFTVSSASVLRTDADFFFAGTLTGTATLTKTGNAGLGVLGDNTAFTGAINLAGGTTTLNSFGDAPLGTGSATLAQGSNLQAIDQIAGSTSSPAAITTTLASGSGSTFTVAAGGGTIAPDAASTDGGSIYTVQLGGNTNGTTSNFSVSSGGSLIIAPVNGTATSNLGSIERVVVAGSGANLPAVTNGIVTPVVVGQNNDGAFTGDFLTYSAANGFVSAAAAYTNGFTAASTEVAEITAATALTASNTAAAARVDDGAGISISTGLTLTLGPSAAAPGGLILNGTSTISGGGALQFGTGGGAIYTAGSGTISTPVTVLGGGLTTFGPGTLTLAGGATVSGGPINVNGTLDPVAMAVSGMLVIPVGTTLAGSASVTAGSGVNRYATLAVDGSVTGLSTFTVFGSLTGSGTITAGLTGAVDGYLAPGNGTPLASLGVGEATAGDPETAVLSTGSLSLNAGFTTLFELDGTTVGTGYDQLSVTGAVLLNNATLDVLDGSLPTVAPGTSFTLIANDGNDPVVGTFDGLSQGATYTADDGRQFLVSYTGGTGNDVTLQLEGTAVPEPTTFAAAVIGGVAVLARRRRR